ncbi:hypothetical protein EVAR_51215_1 [Eumeta japonica]|uniref:115 kDa protein in type-1 retrotransposable element R1DM n=1 Tax=Eumeta variegata TaxID=151549 RepID=A0A4C1Z927_EUMVA|nr:hypothetical protein EVAR_51215_1 [Eumeta japonica]
MTSHLAQTLTGHGGFSQYLHRFKLKDSPYCACDPAKIQDVLHVLEECPMFLRERVALETEIGVICHPVPEVSPALYTRLIKAGFVYVGLQRRPVWDQSPLVQCSRCLGFSHSKKYCRELNDKCAHCGDDHTGPLCPGRKAAQPPKVHQLHESRLRGRRSFGI